MHDTEMHIIRDAGHCAKEICNSMRTGQVTDEQGKEALFRLLLAACGAKEKGKQS